MRNVKSTIPCTLEGPNIVKFADGTKIEVFASRVLITKPDLSSTLEVPKRLTESYYEENGTPSCWEIYWPSSPKWSDGTLIDPIEVLELARLIKAATTKAGERIQQFFKGRIPRSTDRDDFNSF